MELGVPPYLAFRVKDPAQSGSGIHQIIENLAKAHSGDANAELVNENIRTDKGSLYRYGEGIYGEDGARSYVQMIHQEIQSDYRKAILTA